MELMVNFMYFLIILQVRVIECGKHEKRLLKMFSEKLDGFNVYERPAELDEDTLKVEMRLTLQQIIDVDEKNQIIYTNMWLTMQWKDYKLKWDPLEYNNITQISIPPHLIWKPDILMYNSLILCSAKAESRLQRFYGRFLDLMKSLLCGLSLRNTAADSFDATFQSRIRVRSDGAVEQIPPGMFKSTCHINIRWFPFDEQECTMKFGSWTYDGTQIDLRFLDGVPEGSMEGFAVNGEWDLIGIPAIRNVFTYECCPQNPFVDLTYSIKIRRRKLYHLVNIIGPCMLFAFLGLFTFCLPPDAGEKISFSVTILLSLTVFMMIVSETLPVTSEAIPLIAIYFMGIMVMTALSVVATITALRFHHRTPSTNKMSRFVKVAIGEWLAWLLRMKRPGSESPCRMKSSWRKQGDLQMMNMNTSQSLLANIRTQEMDNDTFYCSFGAGTPHQMGTESNHTLKLDAHPLSVHNVNSQSNHSTLAAGSSSQPLARFELRAILKELRYLTNVEREKASDEQVIADWKWCAMVIDRLFIWVVGILNIIVAVAVLLSAPTLFGGTTEEKE